MLLIVFRANKQFLGRLPVFSLSIKYFEVADFLVVQLILWESKHLSLSRCNGGYQRER